MAGKKFGRKKGFFVKDLNSFFELARIEHGVMYLFGLLIGAALAGWDIYSTNSFYLIIPAALATLFIEIGAFSLNDYFDKKSDTINKRIDRPIVRGTVSPVAAKIIGILFLFLGNLLALMLSFFSVIETFVIVFLFSVGSIFYNLKMKKYAVIGNVFIGITMALPFLFGALVIGNFTESVAVLAGIAFVVGVGREIMKDIQDIKGDKKTGAKTLPLVIGKKKSVYSVIACYFMAILLSIIPFFTFFKGEIYYFLVLLTDLILIIVSAKLLRYQNLSTLKFGRKWTLVAIIIGLIAFLLSSF